MRQQVTWRIGDDIIFGTLDSPEAKPNNIALLIVSGGNEIRSGSHNGQSQMAQYMADKGYHVLRYDRRGVGDSNGINQAFDNSQDDIASAANFLQSQLGKETKIIAFGNCDAASALLLNHDALGFHKLIMANPWTIDPAATEKTTDTNKGTNDKPDASSNTDPSSTSSSSPSAAAIRARYWARIKNPRSFIDLFTGKIDLRKLIMGLLKASKQEDISKLAIKMTDKLSAITIPTHILIAEKDTTARAFMGAYKSKAFESVRSNSNVKIESIDSASHSFADDKAKSWLYDKIISAL